MTPATTTTGPTMSARGTGRRRRRRKRKRRRRSTWTTRSGGSARWVGHRAVAGGVEGPSGGCPTASSVQEERKRKREKEHGDSEAEADVFEPGKKVEVEPPPDRPVRACRTQPGKCRVQLLLLRPIWLGVSRKQPSSSRAQPPHSQGHTLSRCLDPNQRVDGHPGTSFIEDLWRPWTTDASHCTKGHGREGPCLTSRARLSSTCLRVMR